MVPVLEAVPNFSAGRDPGLLERLVRAAAGAGADVLDVSADANHNRAVLTFVGTPAEVEAAALEVARVAVDAIDMRAHVGAHPRVGALDVLPFVPLSGLTLDDATEVARRVGRRLAEEVGVPVFFYAAASDPPGRALSELRRGGFETLARGLPDGRVPDVLPPGRGSPRVHPTAGATCVGARPVLLAWNVDVAGVEAGELGRVAAELRETGGGFSGLRAIALDLGGTGRTQISMNLEDVSRRDPFAVFRALEERIAALGGEVVATEVIGLRPDELVLSAGADRLRLLDPDPARGLSSRLAAHLSTRAARSAERLLRAVRESEAPLPPGVAEAVRRLARDLITDPDRQGAE